MKRRAAIVAIALALVGCAEEHRDVGMTFADYMDRHWAMTVFLALVALIALAEITWMVWATAVGVASARAKGSDKRN